MSFKSKHNLTFQLKSSIQYTLILILVVSAFFLRGFEFPSRAIDSFSYLTPIFTLMAAIYTGWVFRNFAKIPKDIGLFITIFISLITITVVLNIITTDNHEPIILFAIEMYLNVALFITIYMLSKDVDTKRILDLLLVVGFIFSSYVLYLGFVELDSIRRIGNTELPIGVNHLSHALAVSFAVGITKLYYHRKRIIILPIILLTILTAMYFTGSRSGFLSIGAVVGTLVLLEGRDAVSRLVPIFTIGAGVLFIISAFIVQFSGDGGLGRISYYNLLDALLVRIARYIEVIELVFASFPNIFFGAGMENYTVLFDSTPIIGDPHNIWLSIALFYGLPAALMFSIIHVNLLINSFRIIVRNSHRDVTLITLFLSLIVVSIYSFFSGRLTRIFTIWIVMGLILGRISRYQ